MHIDQEMPANSTLKTHSLADKINRLVVVNSYPASVDASSLPNTPLICGISYKVFPSIIPSGLGVKFLRDTKFRQSLFEKDYQRFNLEIFNETTRFADIVNTRIKSCCFKTNQESVAQIDTEIVKGRHVAIVVFHNRHISDHRAVIHNPRSKKILLRVKDCGRLKSDVGN